jgi:hypothetical protein
MPWDTNPSGSDSDAEFIGWQETSKNTVVPLFNITVADHPSCHSTVCEGTLRRLGLRVPGTLSPFTEMVQSEWRKPGTKLNHTKAARHAIEIAGLDYTVVKQRDIESEPHRKFQQG